MPLTRDILLERVGVPDGSNPVAAPVGAAQQLWHGGVALLSTTTSPNAGYLKNAATPLATDIVMGLVDQSTGGTYAEVAPGILGGATDGAVFVDVVQGTFLFTSGTAGDALTVADTGDTVYYGGEGTNTIVAAKTDGGGTRPVLGVLMPLDPTIPAGKVPVRITFGSP